MPSIPWCGGGTLFVLDVMMDIPAKKSSYEMMPNGKWSLGVRESRREREGAKEMKTEKEKERERAK